MCQEVPRSKEELFLDWKGSKSLRCKTKGGSSSSSWNFKIVSSSHLKMLCKRSCFSSSGFGFQNRRPSALYRKVFPLCIIEPLFCELAPMNRNSETMRVKLTRRTDRLSRLSRPLASRRYHQRSHVICREAVFNERRRPSTVPTVNVIKEQVSSVWARKHDACFLFAAQPLKRIANPSADSPPPPPPPLREHFPDPSQVPAVQFFFCAATMGAARLSLVWCSLKFCISNLNAFPVSFR